MWKGIWDFIDKGLSDLLKNVKHNQLINFSLSAFIGYGIFFTIIAIQKKARKRRFAAEICHILAFISVIALWHCFEDGTYLNIIFMSF